MRPSFLGRDRLHFQSLSLTESFRARYSLAEKRLSKHHIARKPLEEIEVKETGDGTNMSASSIKSEFCIETSSDVSSSSGVNR